MDCLVRDSTEHDMAEVHAIYRHHVLHGAASFDENPPSVGELTRRRAHILGHGLPYLVAELGDRVAGFCYAAPYRSRFADRYTVEDTVYVDHRLGRRGIGAALLSGLVHRCETGPWRQMIAVIGDSDNAGSIALHRSLGIRHAGTLRAVGFKFGRCVDRILMQRALGTGDTALPVDASAHAPAPAELGSPGRLG